MLNNRQNPMTIPPSHGELIRRMQILGYVANDKGICFGIAYMGMLAILAEDVATFDQAKLNALKEGRLGKIINTYKNLNFNDQYKREEKK